VYRAQGLLADARAIRDRMGTRAFLAELPASGDAGWGEVDAGWSAAQLDEAFGADPASELAQRLISDVVPTFMPSYVDSVAGAASAFVPLDQGLAALSNHAKSLGYDGVVLFLDELVLWLAGKIADQAFVGRETEKVAKLVESSDANRAVPIISFIARQRDLRELVGSERTGAEALSFQDQLSYWDGRFSTVTLEDRNLPVIAEQRILKPRDAEAAQRIVEAFRRTDALPAATRDVLLSDGDTDDLPAHLPVQPRVHGHAGARVLGTATRAHRAQAHAADPGGPARRPAARAAGAARRPVRRHRGRQRPAVHREAQARVRPGAHPLPAHAATDAAHPARAHRRAGHRPRRRGRGSARRVSRRRPPRQDAAARCPRLRVYRRCAA